VYVGNINNMSIINNSFYQLIGDTSVFVIKNEPIIYSTYIIGNNFYTKKGSTPLDAQYNIKIYKNKNHTQEYTGDMKKISKFSLDCIREGKGKTYYNTGAIHIGEYLNNMFHGQGELKIDNITTIEGLWKEDKINNGKKTIVNSLGCVIYEYIGDFDSNFMPHGKGILVKSKGILVKDNETFDGEFVHDKFKKSAKKVVKNDTKDTVVKRKTIPKPMREKVWRKRNNDSVDGKCYCCNKNLSIFDFECGHIVSHANGGKATLKNLEPICKPCNCSMGTVDLEEFKAALY
jgi:hypothetical protein